MRQLLAFARALDVPVTDLTGQPYMPTSPGEDAGHGAVAAIRRELLVAQRTPRISDTDAVAVSLPELRARVADVHAKHRLAALRSMGDDLPDLLRDLRIASHVLPDTEQPELYGLRARAYEAAMDMLKQTGYVADSTAAIERARWAAQRAADPLCALIIDWHYAGEFIRVGELDDATDIIDSGLAALRLMARERIDAAALSGMYELKAALVSARAGDAAALWERWNRAETVAIEVGHDREEPLAFGPSNVAIWSVALPVEMLDGASAVKRAERVNPALDALRPAASISKGQYSRERIARHWVDVARAYHYRADYDRALSAILKAERLAALRTRIEPSAREVVGHMLRVRRKDELVELGLRMGVV
jgi:tetratricopeptide (TPR) repeat protein